ncbi:MAG TPA: polymer-forming cytoskeletal protein [Pyrinomonadaceae bacterium]|nr:polymer-forming cytoskeletal protein [Pyrinomonadaceae bacterium]
MGRSSKPEEPATPAYNGGSTPAPSYQYGNDAAQASNRVVTDSESIARDIKEGRLSGFVGHGTVLTGETNFQMMLRVDGHLTGTVTSEGGTLIVGTNGQVDANVSVSVATVNGAVNGDVIATEKIHLGRTARVIGNISTPRLVIEEGAVFEGGCTMLKARESQERQVTESQAQQEASQFSSYQADEDDEADTDDFVSSADEDEAEDEEAEAATVS